MTFPELTPLTAALFDLPPAAQRQSNLCSMANFFIEAGRIMDEVELSRVIEIGCEDGVNTAALWEYVRNRNAKLTAVDPAEVKFPFSASAKDGFTFFRGTSKEFLNGGFRGEIVFMDGDHNYETVLSDLLTIDRNKAASGIKIVFMHDVSWPWARRDNYYDLKQVSDPRPNRADVNVSPYADADKFYLPPFDYSVAESEGGERNGVLTAVEDFLAGNSGSWRFWRLPVFYGIGILCCTGNLSEREYAAVSRAAEDLNSHRELLATLELNRIENLCLVQSLRDELARAGVVWNSDQAYIREANLSLSKLTEKFELNDTQITYLQSIVSEKDSRIDALRSSLDRSVANETFQKDVCAKLTQQLEQARSDCELRQNECRDMKKEVDELTRQNKTAARECEAAKTAIGELESVRKRLSEELAAERAAAEKQKGLAELKSLELDAAFQRCSDVEEQKGALQSLLSEKNEAYAEVSRELDRCQDLLREAGSRELALEATLWSRDQELRRMRLNLTSERWRVRSSGKDRILPYGARNRERLRRIVAMLEANGIDVLSLDVFDTLLLRGVHSELKRFREIAAIEAARYPGISARTFYEARALAHHLTYHAKNAVQGCREPRAEAIFVCMANILALPGDAAEVLAALELRYEEEHLHANPAVCAIVRRARRDGIPVIAMSDMYWSGGQISELLRKCLPADVVVDRVFCSSDFGVSKASGQLYDRVLKELNCKPERMLHLGDNRDSDCVVPFLRHGIDAVWLPRSDLYNRHCARQQRKMMEKLKSAGIVNGI